MSFTSITVNHPESVAAAVTGSEWDALGPITLVIDDVRIYLTEAQARLLMAGIVTALADVYDATEATK